MRRKITLMLMALFALAAFAADDIVISPESGTDIAVELASAKESVEAVGNITINLAEGGEYTVSAPIVASQSLVINGNGATIDASTIDGAGFISYTTVGGVKAMKDESTESAYTIVENVTVKDVEISGLIKPIINNTYSKVLFKTILINNCVIEITGNFNAFNLGVAYPENLKIEKTTIWSNEGHTGFFFKADGKPADISSTSTTTWTVDHCTLVNISVDKKANNSNGGIKGKKTTTMVLTNSILYNFGSKSGNEVNGWLWGQNGGANAIYTNNTYWSADGSVAGWTDSSKGGSDQTGTDLPTDPEFADAANGDFTLGTSSKQLKHQTGDPRWATGTYVPAPEDLVDITLDLPNGGDITAAMDAEIAEIEGQDKTVGNVSINLGFMAKATISKPIVVSKGLTIKGDNATIDASANAGALIKMNNEPSVALNEKGKAYEVGEFLIEGVTFKGVNSYVYDDQQIPYVYSSYTINNCVFEFTNNKSDIDCPFRFQGGAPLKFVLTNSTLYKNGSNTFKYLVKMSNSAGNAPDALVNLVDYEWQIENNTFFGVTSSTELMNNGRVANNYTKTSVTLNKNIFVDCASSSKDFLKNLFGSKYNDTEVAKFKKYESNLNTYFSDGKDVSAKQERYDRGMILTTDPQFANAAKGDFTPFVGSKQQKHQTGDPRWLTYFDPEQAPVEDVTIEMADGENINAMLYEATTDVDKLGDITILLANDATVTISEPIVAPKSVTIGVEGNGQATIDASALNGPMITTPAEAPAEWVAGNVEISGITVKGLKKALYASAAKNYLYDNFMIKDCVVEVAGDATTIDFTKGSVAKDINVTSSTFYAPTATTKAFYSSQGGQKATEADAEMVQTFTFEGNTMYNLAPTKNFFSHRQNNQKWLAYTVKNNLFVNCGKSGQVIKGMNGGQQGTNPTWAIDGNAFNFNGEDTSAAETTGDAEEAVENSVAGVIEFTDVEAPDFGGTFTLGEGATAPAALGDDCWTITFTEATGIETVKTAEDVNLENAVIYNLNGQRVDKAQKGLYIVNGKKVVIK